MAQMLTERYRERLHGVLSCYDRIVITRQDLFAARFGQVPALLLLLHR